jgi:uroporphyrinogen-III synthase
MAISGWLLRLLTGPWPPLGSDVSSAIDSPLSGRRVVTTRENRGRIEYELAALGAEVLHLPLIEVVDVEAMVPDTEIEWVVVTSPNGARRAGPFVNNPTVRLAAVGDATADVLESVAGRPVDLVPERATADDLARVLPAPAPTSGAMVVLRGDLASDTVAVAARQTGWTVIDIIVYRTVALRPGRDVVVNAADADVVLLTSGSAARSWSSAITDAGVASPPVVVIGVPTSDVAQSVGLPVVATADPPGIDGLIAATIDALGRR